MPQAGWTTPTVSVVVPHYNSLADLDRCLQALAAQTYPRDRYEIIVADNNSPQGAAAVAAVVGGRAKLVFVLERGAGPARNGGAAIATGEVLAFTDADCVPDAKWLEAGVRKLSECDVVGGAMTVSVTDEAHPTPCEAFERVFAFNNKNYVEKQGFTVSANLLCTREIFRRVGEFLPAGIAEDQEWCWRATAAGCRLGYAADALVAHPARRTWDDLLKKWRRSNTDNFHLMTSAAGGRTRWLIRTLLLPVSAVVHTPKALFSDRLNGFGARLGAISTLYRHRLWRMRDSLRLYAEAR